MSRRASTDRIEKVVNLDVSKWPNISAYLARVGERPKVREAMQAEGLMK